MPEIDMKEVREYAREYVTNSSDLKNVSMKSLRKYIEKKLGLPKKSLVLQKSVLKEIISEEISAVAKVRGAAEAKKASNETEKETVKSTAKNTTKGVEKGAEKDAEKGKKKVDKKTEKKVDKKPETESKVTNENEDVTEDDDVKPKKPLSSYMLFCREKRSSVMSQFPEYKAKEVVTKLGEMWQALSDKEKAKYVSLAQENREQYAKQMKEWREQHPDSITHSDMKQKRTQRAHIPEEFIIEKTTELPELRGRLLNKEIKALWKKLNKKERQKYLDNEPESTAPKPKRALSPYNFFCRLHRADIVKQNPEANPKEVMGLLAKAWQNVDRGVLFECQKLSEEDKQKKASECVDEPEKKTSEHTDEPEKKEKKVVKERHISGYCVYLKEKYAELKTEDTTSRDLMKDIAKQWRELDDNDKKEYAEKAEKVSVGHNSRRLIPQSAFALYAKESRKQLLKQHQGISKEEATNLLKEMWKKLDTEEKIEYENRLHEMRVQKIREEDDSMYFCLL
ncbi:hypothetical protein WA171_006804 [Blastocystis sp. BT1]